MNSIPQCHRLKANSTTTSLEAQYVGEVYHLLCTYVNRICKMRALKILILIILEFACIINLCVSLCDQVLKIQLSCMNLLHYLPLMWSIP